MLAIPIAWVADEIVAKEKGKCMRRPLLRVCDSIFRPVLSAHDGGISMNRYSVALAMHMLMICSCQSLEAPPRPTSTHYSHNFLIVHGAWGGGWAFRDVESMLLADGHKVHRPTLT